ncbi:hypothetical protein DFJ74DRAFT_663030 [Hyaloraphidium curvatum]|nr:hypothetical protein DFJ74DRAFT_663030 [Hyaloraphidium curvatum]
MALPQFSTAYITATAVALALFLLTAAAFLYRALFYRPPGSMSLGSPSLRRRPVFLTAVGALGGTVFVSVALSYAAFEWSSGYPCALQSTLLPWGGFLAYYSVAARARRLVLDSEAQKFRDELSSSQDLSEPSTLCHSLSDVQLTLIVVGLFTVYILVQQSLVTTGSGFRNMQYGLVPNPPVNPLGICPGGPEFYVQTAILGVFFVIVFPYSLYRLSKIRRDAYGIMIEIVVGQVLGVLAYAMMLGWTLSENLFVLGLLAGVTVYIWPIAAFLAIHVGSVIVPLVYDLLRPPPPPPVDHGPMPTPKEPASESRRSSWISSTPYLDFISVASRSPSWPAFRGYLVRCLCVENAVFLEDHAVLLDAMRSGDPAVENMLRGLHDRYLCKGSTMELDISEAVKERGRDAFVAAFREDEGIDLVVRSDGSARDSISETLPGDAESRELEAYWASLGDVWNEVVAATFADYKSWAGKHGGRAHGEA